MENAKPVLKAIGMWLKTLLRYMLQVLRLEMGYLELCPDARFSYNFWIPIPEDDSARYLQSRKAAVGMCAFYYYHLPSMVRSRQDNTLAGGSICISASEQQWRVKARLGAPSLRLTVVANKNNLFLTALVTISTNLCRTSPGIIGMRTCSA